MARTATRPIAEPTLAIADSAFLEGPAPAVTDARDLRRRELSDGVLLPDLASASARRLRWNNGLACEGDCLELLPSIPDGSIDMILCDLPYGTTRNKWDSIIPLDRLWSEYMRIIKPTGVIALTSQGLFTARLVMSNESWFRYKFVWIKSKPTNFLNARRQPLRRHEDVCIFYRKQPRYRPLMWQSTPYDKGGEKRPKHGKLQRIRTNPCEEQR